jgi:hypothetical protein
MCNGHSPTDKSVRSGEAVMWLAKANGFILVRRGSLTGIIYSPPQILRGSGSTLKQGDWHVAVINL